MKKQLITLLSAAIFLILIQSCGQNTTGVKPEDKVLLYSKAGLVDSAWVTCCCTSIKRAFSDTLHLSGYKEVKIEFDGNTNSKWCEIDLLYSTNNISSHLIYSAKSPDSLIGSHTIHLNIPGDSVLVELRTIIFPQICGFNELLYTRSRDFKIYGIK